MRRCESEWAARRYRTLTHVAANWIGNWNAADNLDDLCGSEIALESGDGRQSSTVSVSGSEAVSSLDGNGVGGVGSGQEIVGEWLG
jgi:hypothetical protein